MSISDILTENSKKMLNKSLTGDTIVPGLMLGIVKENNNNKFPGRVRVQIPTRDKDKNILQWMKVCALYAGPQYGLYCVPEIGDQVLVGFVNGNINNAYVLGSIFKNDSDFVSENYTDENYKKSLITNGKNQFLIYDETDKQKIKILTPKQHSLMLDDEADVISFKDKDNKNSVEINSKDGLINIKAEKKLNININDAKITISEDGKTVSVVCGSCTIKADDNVNIKGQNVKIDATTFSVSASNGVKIKADGMVKISGQTVKLG